MTEPAAKKKPALLVAPASLDLATIKDDLGMPADDTTNDAWLQRRIDAVWARFEAYTGRTLGTVGDWRDDWSEIARNNVRPVQPWVLNPWPRASVFLRVFPVQSIAALTLNGTTADPTMVIVDGKSGKVLSLDGVRLESDCGPRLLGGQAVIDYKAGFAGVPLDLYDALVGCLGPLWEMRAAQQAATGGGMGGRISRINAVDVGEVDFDLGGSAFVEAASKGVSDPTLGPYTAALDPYVDWRAFIGGEVYPTTIALPPPGP